MKNMLRGFVLVAVSALTMRAHFVFVVPQTGDTGARIFISETLQPDPAVDAGLVSGSKLSLRDAAGKDAALTLIKSGDVYAVRLGGSGTRVIHGLTDDNVYVAHSLALIQALFAAGKRADFVPLSSTHMVPDPKILLAREKLQIDFFREHLGP